MMNAGREAGLAAGTFEVLFIGVEEGRVEAALRAVLPGTEASLTGLESSVIDGEGFGIEPFRAVVQSSPTPLENSSLATTATSLAQLWVAPISSIKITQVHIESRFIRF